MQIKEINETDWRGILKVQAEVYVDIVPEKEEVLRHKWLYSPASCFIWEQENNVHAYILAHAWDEDTPPKLHTLLPAGRHGETLFLHDLAVANAASGLGVGSRLVNHLIDCAIAEDFKKILLVAVQGSSTFWQKMGFSELPGITPCLSYGERASVMQRVLSNS